jgi:hypothetical protein
VRWVPLRGQNDAAALLSPEMLLCDVPVHAARGGPSQDSVRAAISVGPVAELVVVVSDQMDPGIRLQARLLWDRAFGARFSDDNAEHAYGGVHVLACDEDRLIGHASAVPRRIRFADEPWRSVALRLGRRGRS